MEALNSTLNWVVESLTSLFSACTSGDFGLLGFAFVGLLLIRQFAKAFHIIKK